MNIQELQRRASARAEVMDAVADFLEQTDWSLDPYVRIAALEWSLKNREYASAQREFAETGVRQQSSRPKSRRAGRAQVAAVPVADRLDPTTLAAMRERAS